MEMTYEKEKQAFLNFLQEQNYYKQNLQLLQWDSHTQIPIQGYEQRAEVIGYFSEKLHQLQSSEQMKYYIDYFIDQSKDALLQNLAYECQNIYDYATKIPSSLAKAYAMQISKAEAAWEVARNESNYAQFKPALQKMIQLTQAKTDCLGDGKNRYDALLQQWEPGMTTQTLDQLFPKLRSALIDLLAKVNHSQIIVDEQLITQHFPSAQQKAICLQLLTNIGFDHTAGRLDTSEHPFTFGLHARDVRITTRYDETDFRQSIFGVLHEGGHALYEQSFGKDIQNTPLAEASSMGLHESQALLWENWIGRSEEFWSANEALFKKHAPASFQTTTANELYTALHRVQPSLIRVDADEITYSLHIMLRYEIEKLLLNDELSVDDLPAVWNEKTQAYLGITPPNDRDGVLQDIHWASGYFGYFPTYTLGFMYAAQIFQTLEREIDIRSLIANNQLTTIHDWLTPRLYQSGKSKLPLQLLEELTNETLRPEYLINYLTEKYQTIYQFK